MVKSGMGYINNPKKAIYNKIYNKTSRSIFDDINSKSNNSYNINAKNDNNPSCSMYETVEKNKIRIGTSYYTTSSLRGFAVFYIIIGIVLIPLSFFIFPFGIITLIVGIWVLFNAYKYLKLCKESDNI